MTDTFTRYCPCNLTCHEAESPCSMDCWAHHGEVVAGTFPGSEAAMTDRLGVNEYGTPVSIHTCTACGDEFTVCPADTTGRFGDECLAPLCPSYDIDRDVDYLLEAGQRIVKEPAVPPTPEAPQP